MGDLAFTAAAGDLDSAESLRGRSAAADLEHRPPPEPRVAAVAAAVGAAAAAAPRQIRNGEKLVCSWGPGNGDDQAMVPAARQVLGPQLQHRRVLPPLSPPQWPSMGASAS